MRDDANAVLALLLAVGCSTSVDNDADAGAIADPLGDGHDECAERGWYGDGQCDTGCLDPDPDCITADCDDACAGYCDASWSGDDLPALPDGCTPELCDCGDPPVECPDLCEAQCYGEPLPDQIPSDCPSFTCDCAEVTADPEAGGILPASGEAAPCATPSPDAATRAELDAEDGASRFLSLASNLRSRRTIPVVFHIIRRTRPKYGGTGAGDVPRKNLIKQLRVMNRAFARTAFKFELTRITRTTNTTWFLMDMGSSAEESAKKKLRRGGKSTMNVYTVGANDWLGWAHYPWIGVAGDPIDGIVLDHAVLPGGEAFGYNRGDTLVHEGGHWFGLFHTFEGGCEIGDGVADTPAEARPAGTCASDLDSCPREGNDPVRNYMDYSDDACSNQFSAGQRSRMSRVAETYRPAGGSSEDGGESCGDGTCSGYENDYSCRADCGCAAVSCSGVAPFGCYCDAECEATGDCCWDATYCEGPPTSRLVDSRRSPVRGRRRSTGVASRRGTASASTAAS